MIAVIEAALANGQSQPWMYDILAMSMKIAGRPQKEIERVLLSRVDFTMTDVPGILYSAAFLARLDAPAQALRMYRQAADLDPSRPEPYVLSLKLARQLNDYEATGWACAGILENVWTNDRVQRHLDAEDAAADALKKLDAEQRSDEAARLRQVVADARRRDLVLRLEWSGNGDLDLEVEEPVGAENRAATCSVLNPRSAGGGRFTHDGYGPDPGNSFDEYVCVRGLSGDYRARISHSSGEIVGKRCQLIVTRHQGTREEVVRKVDVPLDEPEKVVRLSLTGGRLAAPVAVPQEERLPSSLNQSRTRHRIVRLPAEAAQTVAIGPRIAASGRVQPGGGAVQPGGGAVQPGGGAVQLAGGGGAVQHTSGVQSGFRLAAGSLTGSVGYQPVISFIGSGVSLTAAAVVSADRRYVRLSLAPVFSELIELQTFSFLGGAQPPAQGQAGSGQ